MHLPNITIAALLVGMSAFAVPSMSAAQDTPAIDQRQARQSQRIANGQASGKQSNREAARLQAGQAKVANMEANAKADGKVTRAERATIQHEQNKQSRHIAHQKHDGNSR